ncbi:MAG: hypothetical protein JJE25_02255 [Bacteroidia bacterium]|nr:hypothetical protein [Bacteroidia bacterium]
MKNLKNNLNSLTFSLAVLSGILFSLNGFSQTPVTKSNAALNTKVSSNAAPQSSLEIDKTKTINAEVEKPYVTGDDGQKIFFLADPLKSSGEKNENNVKEKTVQPANRDEAEKPKK